MRLFPTFMIFLLGAVLSFNASANMDSSLSPALYKSLNEIQDLMAANELAKAESELHALEEKTRPSFGLALIYQLHGQMHLMKEEQDKALEKFRKALNLNVLAPAQESGIATTEAQILLSMNKPRDAYRGLKPRIERLLESEEVERKKRRNPREGEVRFVQPQSMITLATACQMERRYKDSIPWLRKALKRSDSPKESWLLMLMVATYQEKLYAETAEVLDDLIRLNPSKEDYWQQQASMYQLLEKNQLALRTLELGYAGGYIKKPDSILSLVQLLITQNVPERAGRILQKHLEDGTIELNERNWRILAAAWQQGRERERAVEALRVASDYVKDGSLRYRAAQMQLQDAQYSGALKDAEAALEKGLSDREKPRALMLAASSAYELKDMQTARRYFQQALTYPDTAKNAKSWLDYLATLEQYENVVLSYTR